MRPTGQVGEVDSEWADATRTALDRAGVGRAVLDRVGPVVPAGYDELNDPETAVVDLAQVVALSDGPADLSTAITPSTDGAAGEWRFRVYRVGEAIPIADLLPLFDQLGLRAIDERTFAFALVDQRPVHLHDVGVGRQCRAGQAELDAGRRSDPQHAAGPCGACPLRRPVAGRGCSGCVNASVGLHAHLAYRRAPRAGAASWAGCGAARTRPLKPALTGL